LVPNAEILGRGVVVLAIQIREAATRDNESAALPIGAFINRAGVRGCATIFIGLAETIWILLVFAYVRELVALIDGAGDVVFAVLVGEAAVLELLCGTDEVGACVDGTYVAVVAEVIICAAGTHTADAGVGRLMAANGVGLLGVLPRYAEVRGAFVIVVAVFVVITTPVESGEGTLVICAGSGGADVAVLATAGFVTADDPAPGQGEASLWSFAEAYARFAAFGRAGVPIVVAVRVYFTALFLWCVYAGIADAFVECARILVVAFPSAITATRVYVDLAVPRVDVAGSGGAGVVICAVRVICTASPQDIVDAEGVVTDVVGAGSPVVAVGRGKTAFTLGRKDAVEGHAGVLGASKAIVAVDIFDAAYVGIVDDRVLTDMRSL